MNEVSCKTNSVRVEDINKYFSGNMSEWEDKT